MEILIKIVQLVASLSLLVLVHELGHFLFARLFKCRVDKFYLFFNPWFSLYKKKIGDTEWGIGWLPLGGYCKIAGMVDESMDKEQLKQAPQPWEYRSKPAWQRFFIIIGGVLMNFLLAMVIYIGITFAWGDSYIANGDVRQGYAYSADLQSLGFQNGDKIIAVDGEDVSDKQYTQIQMDIILSDKREVEIERGGVRQLITIPAEAVKRLLKSPDLISLRMPVVVGEVEGEGGAARAGLLAGDSIVTIDSVNVIYFDELRASLDKHKNDTVQIGFYRSGLFQQLPVAVNDEGKIGFYIGGNLLNNYKLSTRDYSLLQSIPRGVERGIDRVDNYLKQLKLIASPETGAYKSVGGFITMGKIFPSEWSWLAFWNITALLSIMLAVLNILPIPALDGGHLVFIIYEMITRRAPSEKFMEIAQYVGFILLIGLLIFANGSDILRLLGVA
ncbi:Membrane-associated zinc metalloprotease [Mucinivorans hirudinis]|uniref:Zinc metalloprotease n=1 Tax=Mucinivorans hirudinis TaxID=1433126 RepID=A0A060RD31_9BACT|nr:Membrane-associated zinc metalloprotease [Mucinivorans hirudinis]